jgi:drug/metabolite transporter (DMT)-like permease
VLAIAAALLSALSYAFASVLQQHAAMAQPEHTSMRLGLLARLLREPIWLVGILCDGLGYIFQFIALGHGSLSLVQPLLVSGLLFALPLSAWINNARMQRRDWIAAVEIVIGLSAFLVLASPAQGEGDVSNAKWAVMFGSIVPVVAVLIIAARGTPGRRRATQLAAAAGLIYGLTAALTKASANLLENGGVHYVLTTWEPYALLAGGLVGMLVSQSAFQAGPLDASLPVLTTVDPVVSIIIGAFAFGESIATGPVVTPLELLGLAVMIVGVFSLTASEAVMEPRSSPVRQDDTG